MLGQAFLPRQATNTLSVLFSPIVNTSLSVETTIRCWNLQQTTNGVLTNTLAFASSKTPSLFLDLPPGDYALEAYFPRVYDGGFSAAWSTNTLHILDNPAIVSLDGCDSLNEAAHHTALYETNALVVRRAQSFRFKTTVTKWFDPARHELRFLLADDFSGTWITNEIPESTATAPTTEWFFRNISSSTNPDERVELTTDVYCSTTNCPIGAYRFSVALFDDRNRNKTIDIYYDYAGFRDRSRSDSTWNFHVWTECWMARGDVENANGWQVVDGTPQEISGGKFQCGPAPRSRVKNNQGGDFDVDFVFAEVAADVRIWQDDATGVACLLETQTNRLGHKISTKQNGTNARLDLTGDYK